MGVDDVGVAVRRCLVAQPLLGERHGLEITACHSSPVTIAGWEHSQGTFSHLPHLVVPLSWVAPALYSHLIGLQNLPARHV